MEVSTKRLAEILDVETRYILALERKGSLEKISTGKWELEKNIQLFIKHQKDIVRKEWERKYNDMQDATKEDDPDYRLKTAKARREELELERDLQKVIYTDDVIKYLQNLAQVILNVHNKLPKKIGKNIEDIKVRRAIQTEVKNLLIEMFQEIRNANITKNIPVDFADTQE